MGSSSLFSSQNHLASSCKSSEWIHWQLHPHPTLTNSPSKLRYRSEMLLEEKNLCFHFDNETSSCHTQEVPIWAHFVHSHCLLKFIHILERGQISYSLYKVVLKARSVPWSGSRHSRTNIVLAQQMSGGRWGNRHASCCIAIKNNLPWSHSLHIQTIYK